MYIPCNKSSNIHAYLSLEIYSKILLSYIFLKEPRVSNFREAPRILSYNNKNGESEVERFGDSDDGDEQQPKVKYKVVADKMSQFIK